MLIASLNHLQLVDSALSLVCNIIERWEKIYVERNSSGAASDGVNSPIALPSASASNGSSTDTSTKGSPAKASEREQPNEKEKEHYFCKVLRELVALFRRERQLGPDRTAYIIRFALCSLGVLANFYVEWSLNTSYVYVTCIRVYCTSIDYCTLVQLIAKKKHA